MAHKIFDTTCFDQKLLLSICILSYNQPEEIERVLISLQAQVMVGVEIVILDDSENDETEILARWFSATLPIRYFHGKKKGVDEAVLFLTHAAKGDFIWWMGDDEITSGGVHNVLKIIEADKKINFIWANYCLSNNPTLAVDFASDQYFDSKNQLLEKAGAGLGFVSAVIFRREVVQPGLDEAKYYIGTQFVSLFIVLYAITRPGKLFYLRGPIVICHFATSEEIKADVIKKDGLINNQAFQVFGINFSNIVNRFSDSFDPIVLKRALKKSFGQMWRGVLVGTVGGWDTTQGKKIKLIRNFWQFPESWIAIILFCLPKKLLSYLYRGYKLFN